MGKNIPPSEGSAGLRQKAEEIFSEKGARFPEDTMTLSPEETRQIVHELRVHQIELEMQNDELRRAYDELDASRAHYSDFYDLAPVGYFTLSEQGLILEANLFAATLLGMPRSELFKQPISRFIFRDDQDIYYLHRKRLFEFGEPREYELRMVNTDGVPFWACLIATIPQGDGDPVCRVIMSHITDRKKAEAEKEKLQDRLNQAQKMESIGRLAGGVAHDFNNMLGVILDEVWCSHHAGSMPGQYVLLSVTDTGCGMDRKMLDHLFEPFFTTKDVGKGTGLGLSMVYGAVKQNNGFITVHSEPGSGTSFRIYLQRHLEKPDPLPAKSPVPSAARGSETILVVEDEPAIMALTTAVLQRLGYAVVAAGSPGKAIRLAGTHPGRIHLLITDVIMLELSARVRAVLDEIDEIR